jgi:hypothetical protein
MARPASPARPAWGPAALLLLLAACDFYPEGSGDSGAAGNSPTSADCSAEISIPTGLINAVPPAPTAHAETYGAAPAPFHVHYSWPSRDPSRNAALLWRSDLDTLASQVEWGPAEGFPTGAQRTDGVSWLFGGAALGEGPYRQHEVRLCGVLQPDTAYSYRVGGEGGWSETYTFRTPPAPGTKANFRVAMSGDSRGTYATWAAVLAAMESHAPDFFLFSGDMVELGANQREWDAWFDASGDVFARKAFMAAHGNHEFLAQHYFVQFAFPGNEEWYSFDYGDTTFLSLNDTVRDVSEAEDVQTAFIAETLSGAQRRRVAMHHQPLYSTCTTHGSNVELRDLWAPLFEDGDVALVLAGHNHIYERSVPIKAGQERPPGEGTVYLVSGGAGAPLYPNSEAEWFGAVANPIEHYVIADFLDDRIELVARDLSGNIIDQVTIPR